MRTLFDDNNGLDQKVELYMKAKAAYYEGREIMSDSEFDKLEDEIKKISPNHPALSIVGYSSKRFEFAHKYPMLSLEKIQVNDEVDSEFEKIYKWISNTKSELDIIIQPKYDGNSISLQYENGVLVRALSRGNGKSGFDVTDKLKSIVPNKISLKDSLEIRGECLIKVLDFEKLNSDDSFKNERNFVAGVLSDTKEAKYLEYLHFVSFNIMGIEYKKYSDFFNILQKDGFELSFYKICKLESSNDAKNLYKEMKEYRENSPYRLDGYVLKVNSATIREKMGENRHHPLYEVAIKFPAQKAQTVIEGIEWSMSAQGELIPTAILKPVDLDGSLVSRAYLANFKNAINNSYLPGSYVYIEKKGDIIPQITGLVKKGDISQDEINALLPSECPYCESDLHIDSDFTHIYCMNSECPEKEIKKMTKAISILQVKNIGPAMVKTLYNAGVKTIFDFFSKSLTSQKLIETGYFKEGRQLDRLFESINSIRSITFTQLLQIQQIEGAGETMCEMVSKYYQKQPHHFTGLEKKVVDYFIEKESYYYNELPKKWSDETNVSIVFPVAEERVDSIKVVLTGSPKDAGFPTKKHFLDKYPNLEEVKNIKDADFLVTNDLSSTSSKMKDAEKHGVKIKTYLDF
ncbi:hypothetical protein JXR93_02795 [bacterium]|nr:hypothetical protein [bacterium]